MKKALSGFVIFLSSVALVGAAAGCGYGVYNTVQSSNNQEDQGTPMEVSIDFNELNKLIEKDLPQVANSIKVTVNGVVYGDLPLIKNFMCGSSYQDLLGSHIFNLIKDNPANSQVVADNNEIFSLEPDEGYKFFVKEINCIEFVSSEVEQGVPSRGFGVKYSIVFKNNITIKNVSNGKIETSFQACDNPVTISFDVIFLNIRENGYY